MKCPRCFFDVDENISVENCPNCGYCFNSVNIVYESLEKQLKDSCEKKEKTKNNFKQLPGTIFSGILSCVGFVFYIIPILIIILLVLGVIGFVFS